MKLLLDQNLSYKILKKVNNLYPDSSHVYLLKLHTATDKEIWDYARLNNYTIVTQDSDFYELSLLHESPPKIIWIKAGNTSTEYIQKILLQNKDVITSFEGSGESCLILF